MGRLFNSLARVGLAGRKICCAKKYVYKNFNIIHINYELFIFYFIVMVSKQRYSKMADQEMVFLKTVRNKDEQNPTRERLVQARLKKQETTK